MAGFANVITESGQLVEPCRRTVLVVDDSRLERTLLKRWLSPEFEVAEAASGIEALAYLHEGGVADILLMDVNMPDKSGIETLETMRETPEFAELPVILMSSADQSAETASKSVMGGSHDYLFKPLIKALLLKKIETILAAVHGKRQAEALQQMMQKKEREIKELRSVLEKDSVSIDTPMEQITSSIARLMKDDSIQNPEIKQELHSILRAIRSSNLYKPNIRYANKADPVSSSFVSVLVDTSEDTTGTFPSHVEETSAELTSWDFNQWEMEEDHLLPLIKEMFASFGLIERFSMDEHKLEQFIMNVRSRYNPNPYHCFRHAFDVIQTSYSVLTSFNAAKYLTHLDILALLIAALAHDIGHPGMNNAYQVASLSDLAVQYNDKSVLEQYHCTTLFRLLLSPSCNILEGLSPEEFRSVRQAIIGCILATDPALHFEHRTKMQQRVDLGTPLDRENPEDRQLVIQTVLMAADISNIAKIWEISEQWGQRVSTEFFAQGDREREEGRKVAPHLDRNVSSTAKTSANFIDFMAVPLYEVVVRMFPSMEPLLGNMAENKRRWRALMEQASG